MNSLSLLFLTVYLVDGCIRPPRVIPNYGKIDIMNKEFISKRVFSVIPVCREYF